MTLKTIFDKKFQNAASKTFLQELNIYEAHRDKVNKNDRNMHYRKSDYL